MHLDTVDLYCARARRQFVGDVTRLLDESASAIEADVGQLLAAAEERVGQLRSVPRLEVVMTEAEREDAEALAKSPDLTAQILRDFETCGLMGESTNKLLCYLAITSRKLPEPPGGLDPRQFRGGQDGAPGGGARLLSPGRRGQTDQPLGPGALL